MNRDLKSRAEQMKGAAVSLHPAVDRDAHAPRAQGSATTLRCLCAKDPVEVKVTRP